MHCPCWQAHTQCCRWFEPCRECHHEAVDEEPLIIWLQGGPGASGTGYGAFEEIGPYTIGFRERKHNWASRANLLFIDNPVGTGFSYVEPHANFSQSNNEIASDLMVFINEWLFGHPEFKKAPMHIFSESYGGKMAIQWARDIDAANKAGKLEVNFRGIALGDSWISPISYVQAWPGYLHALSLLDDAAEEHLATFAADTKQAMEDGNFTGATMLWSATEFEAENLTDSVSFYNVLVHEPGTPLPLAAQKLLHRYHPEKLGHFMNHEASNWLVCVCSLSALASRVSVRELVGIIPDDVIWGAQSGAVFSNLTEDFMLDVVGVVDDVLDRGVPVYIYSGQLDLICCHIGTEDWIQTLDWEGRADFEKAPSQPLLHQDGELMGFRKQHTNLHQFVLLNAGHMVSPLAETTG
eukprot:jgi/Astpho2/1932/e_gw1.00038.110.1_t